MTDGENSLVQSRNIGDRGSLYMNVWGSNRIMDHFQNPDLLHQMKVLSFSYPEQSSPLTSRWFFQLVTFGKTHFQQTCSLSFFWLRSFWWNIFTKPTTPPQYIYIYINPTFKTWTGFHSPYYILCCLFHRKRTSSTHVVIVKCINSVGSLHIRHERESTNPWRSGAPQRLCPHILV